LLREKGATFELESVNIMPMPDWFKEISPARRIPVLRDTDIGKEGPLGTIPHSSAICAYIEQKFPELAIYPEDPYGRVDRGGRLRLAGRFRPRGHGRCDDAVHLVRDPLPRQMMMLGPNPGTGLLGLR